MVVQRQTINMLLARKGHIDLLIQRIGIKNGGCNIFFLSTDTEAAFQSNIKRTDSQPYYTVFT